MQGGSDWTYTGYHSGHNLFGRFLTAIGGGFGICLTGCGAGLTGSRPGVGRISLLRGGDNVYERSHGVVGGGCLLRVNW